jgi:response regulator of citrate/malate metabolism
VEASGKTANVFTRKDYNKLLPLIEYLEVNNNINPKEAKTIINKSPATVRRYLGMLVSVKVLDTKGSTTNITYY